MRRNGNIFYYEILLTKYSVFRYGIHRNTLFLKLHEKHNRVPGSQTVLSEEEKHSLIAHIIIGVATYGFPVTGQDLRFIVKTYFDKRG